MGGSPARKRTRIRRIYAEMDVVLPPREEVSVPVRIVRSSRRNKPFVGVTENRRKLLGVVNGLKQFRQYLLGKHFVIRTDHAALSWLRRTPEPMPQLARWLTLIEHDYEVVHREGRRHANADGLSRRPATDEVDSFHEGTKVANGGPPKLNVIDRTNNEADSFPGEETLSVRESLASLQSEDPELGPIIRMRLNSVQKPSIGEVMTESELTKRMWNQWEQLEVHEGLVYRRNEGKPGEQNALQLLVPRRSVTDVIRRSHEGATGGHFGIKRTIDQVKRRFYWSTWKDDIIRFCRMCPNCNEYHRGKLSRQGPLQPVIAGAPNERYYMH